MLLRPAGPNDAMAVARVHVRSWQAGYRGLLSDVYLDGLRPEERAARYNFASENVHDPLTIVAVGDGMICGFATTSPAEIRMSPRMASYARCMSMPSGGDAAWAER